MLSNLEPSPMKVKIKETNEIVIGITFFFKASIHLYVHNKEKLWTPLSSIFLHNRNIFFKKKNHFTDRHTLQKAISPGHE